MTRRTTDVKYALGVIHFLKSEQMKSLYIGQTYANHSSKFTMNELAYEGWLDKNFNVHSVENPTISNGQIEK